MSLKYTKKLRNYEMKQEIRILLKTTNICLKFTDGRTDRERAEKHDAVQPSITGNLGD